MTTIPDHYAALGIDPTADPEVITAAYRALAKKFHPDTGSAAGTADAARFDAVQQAYEVLRNPDTRHAYDLELLAATEAELEAHIASKRRVVLRERTAEQARATASPPPDLGDIRPEPAAPARAGPKPRRSVLPFAVPLLLVMLLGGGAAWLFLPDGPAAPPLPGAAKQDAQAVTEAAAPAPDEAPAAVDAPAAPPASQQATASQPADAQASDTPPVFGSTATETATTEAATTETASAASPDQPAAPADAPVFGSSGTLDAATAVEAPADAASTGQPSSAPQQQQQAAPPPLPKARPAAPVKQAQKPAPQKKPQAQPRARVAVQDPPQYYPEPDGYPPPPPGMEPPGFGPDPFAPPGYDQGFLPGRGPYRLVIFERQPGRPATAWSAGVVFKSIGKCTKQGVKAVLRRTGGDPYGDGTRVWYECQRLSQR